MCEKSRCVVPRLNNWGGPFVSGRRDCLQLLTRAWNERGEQEGISAGTPCLSRVNTERTPRAIARRECDHDDCKTTKPNHQHPCNVYIYNCCRTAGRCDADAPLFNNSLCVCVVCGDETAHESLSLSECERAWRRIILYLYLSVCL